MTMAGIPKGATRAGAAQAKGFSSALNGRAVDTGSWGQTKQSGDTLISSTPAHTDKSTNPAAANTEWDFQTGTVALPNFVSPPLIDSALMSDINYFSAVSQNMIVPCEQRGGETANRNPKLKIPAAR